MFSLLKFRTKKSNYCSLSVPPGRTSSSQSFFTVVCFHQRLILRKGGTRTLIALYKAHPDLHKILSILWNVSALYAISIYLSLSLSICLYPISLSLLLLLRPSIIISIISVSNLFSRTDIFITFVPVITALCVSVSVSGRLLGCPSPGLFNRSNHKLRLIEEGILDVLLPTVQADLPSDTLMSIAAITQNLSEHRFEHG